MLTDWVLTHRLAGELDERLHGARIDDAGLLDDGRVALSFRSRGLQSLLAFDLFASPPLLTVEQGELGISDEPGFVRALARSLRGMTLSGVTARRFDRLLRLTFSARSRFGVGEELELYAELVPRFGNLVLVKGDRIVAALKEFAPSDNAQRSVRAGDAYALPPLPASPRVLSAQPPDADSSGAPLYVYRRAGALLQAYVTPLDGFDDAAPAREPSLLGIFAELHAQQRASAGKQRDDRRRRGVRKQLDAGERKAKDELGKLAQKRARAQQRDALRAEGEEIFATLHTLDEAGRASAKERAGKLFGQYKRLTKSVPHIDERRRRLAALLEAIEMLRWEAERAGDDDLASVETAVLELAPRRKNQPGPVESKRQRKRPLLEFRTACGSRIVVGRSPTENAELTFRLARPNDLWFHARGVPGAHVILAREDHAPPPDEDLRTAASFAAFYSRAKAATSVDVDYTFRKHVRKRRAGPPGLVWYTQAQTIAAQPNAVESGGEGHSSVERNV